MATKKAPSKKPPSTEPVKLLSGGNPQIAKAYGDAPVQAFIAAMPSWNGGMSASAPASISPRTTADRTI